MAAALVLISAGPCAPRRCTAPPRAPVVSVTRAFAALRRPRGEAPARAAGSAARGALSARCTRGRLRRCRRRAARGRQRVQRNAFAGLQGDRRMQSEVTARSACGGGHRAALKPLNAYATPHLARLRVARRHGAVTVISCQCTALTAAALSARVDVAGCSRPCLRLPRLTPSRAGYSFRVWIADEWASPFRRTLSLYEEMGPEP